MQFIDKVDDISTEYNLNGIPKEVRLVVATFIVFIPFMIVYSIVLYYCLVWIDGSGPSTKGVTPTTRPSRPRSHDKV